MLKSELIKQLNEISEQDFEVCVFDWVKNEKAGEVSSQGIYPKFDVELIENDAEEKVISHFIALTFSKK